SSSPSWSSLRVGCREPGGLSWRARSSLQRTRLCFFDSSAGLWAHSSSLRQLFFWFSVACCGRSRRASAERDPMTLIARSWLRVPVVVRAVLTGVAVAGAGTLPWAGLVSANIRHQSALPWAVPIMAVYLWLFWRYFVGGWGWPRSTARARRIDSRFNRPPGDTWGPALLAGFLGLGSVMLLQGVLSRLVALPQQRDIDVSKYSFVTVLLWVLMGAVVAGVVEETAFRGYMQRPIERRHGLVVAILVTG